MPSELSKFKFLEEDYADVQEGCRGGGEITVTEGPGNVRLLEDISEAK